MCFDSAAHPAMKISGPQSRVAQFAVRFPPIPHCFPPPFSVIGPIWGPLDESCDPLPSAHRRLFRQSFVVWFVMAHRQDSSQCVWRMTSKPKWEVQCVHVASWRKLSAVLPIYIFPKFIVSNHLHQLSSDATRVPFHRIIDQFFCCFVAHPLNLLAWFAVQVV